MSDEEEHGVIKAMKEMMAAQELEARKRHETALVFRTEVNSTMTQVGVDMAAVKIDVKDLGEKITDQRVDMATMGEKVKSARAIADGANKKAQAALLGVPLAEDAPTNGRRVTAAAKRHAPGFMVGGAATTGAGGILFLLWKIIEAWAQSGQ